MEQSSDSSILLSTTKEFAELVRREANEQTKVQKLEGGRQLVTKIDEVILELEEQNSWILEAAESSKIVHSNLRILHDALNDIHKFLLSSKSTSLTLFKGSLTKSVILLQTHLRSKQTQLMTSVSLEILAKQHRQNAAENRLPIHEVEKEIKEDLTLKPEVNFNNAVKHYHGIGQEKNYNLAFTQFKSAAEDGHSESMYMLYNCYQNGYGTDRNFATARSWLEKAVSAGSPSAKTELAMILLYQVQCIRVAAIVETRFSYISLF